MVHIEHHGFVAVASRVAALVNQGTADALQGLVRLWSQARPRHQEVSGIDGAVWRVYDRLICPGLLRQL